MSGIFHQASVPPSANKEDMAQFEKRFSDETKLDETIQAAFINYGSFMTKARDLMNDASSKLVLGSSSISDNINCIAEEHRLLMFECVGAAGLNRFAPDVMGSADSMYNLVHEQVAIRSFQLVAARGGYSFMQCNIALTKNKALLAQMYRNFEFSYLKNLVKKEMKKPGRIAEDCEKTNTGKRRKDVRCPSLFFVCCSDPRTAFLSPLQTSWGYGIQRSFEKYRKVS